MNEDPWRIDARQYPGGGSLRARLEFLAGYAVLAPSTHNTQPWLFQLRDDALELYADHQRKLPVVDPEGRELVISCGAALALLDCAARHFGEMPHIGLLPDPARPDLLASIRLAGVYQASEDENRRFGAILKRRTTRLAFEERAPAQADLIALAGLARHRGLELRLITEKIERETVAELVAEADRLQMEDRRFREELADWMRSSHADTHDGMSDAAMGMPDAVSAASALVVRTFDIGGGLAARNRQLAAGSPVLGILASADDTVLDWLMTGMALGDILLDATAAGICTAYLNQPIETESLRFRLRQCGVSGVPQILLRLGYGKMVPHAGRRPLRHVICG